MHVLQKTSIRVLKRFPTAMHTGKMYICHLFRYGQLTTPYRCLDIRELKQQNGNVTATAVNTMEFKIL